MSLRLILGDAGAGKTRRAESEILDAARGAGGAPLIYIVPEQATLQAERALTRGGKAMIRLEVLSFNRLAFRVIAETGGAGGRNIDGVGKAMLIRKIIADTELNYVRGKSGEVEEISEVITELKKYRVSPEELEAKAKEGAGLGVNLRRKMEDIARIYRKYSEFVENESVSSDTSLDVLSRELKNSEKLRGALVWIDGFYGFAPQELAVIAALLSHAGSVTACLTVPRGAAFFPEISELDIYAEPKRTVNQLAELAGNPEIIYLERERPDAPKTLTYCDDIYGEAENAACRILSLVRGEGFRWRDIAVAAPRLEDFRKVLQRVFADYGIPLFIDSRNDVVAQPLAELMRAALDVPRRFWSYESVFCLLKTGFMPLGRDDLFEFENYCVEFGISGYKWKREAWAAGGSRYDLDKINGVKNMARRLLAPLAELEGKKREVREFLRRLCEVFTNILEESGVDLAPHKQTLNLLALCFDEMAGLLGEYRVTMAEFADILDAGLAEIDTGHIPPKKDQVVAGSFDRSRFPQARALFVLGMNERAMRPPENNGLLTDEERESLRERGLVISPAVMEKNTRMELYARDLFTKADKIYISLSKWDISGKTLYPARLLEKFDTRAEGLPEGFVKTPEASLKEIGEALRGEKTPLSAAVIKFYEESPLYSGVLRQMRELGEGLPPSERLCPETVDRLYGEEIGSSISRLESYAKCPYMYFLKYNLGLRERSVYKVEFIDVGNLFHKILERFSVSLDEKGLSWRGAAPAQIDALVDEALDYIKESDERGLWGEENAPLLGRAARVAKKSVWALCEHIKRGDFIPRYNEFPFRSEVATSVVVDMKGRKLVLSGRIDRVDMLDFDGGSYVKIIDYKSGSAQFSLSDVYYGMQLQLLLYLDSFMKSSGQTPRKLPGGVFYFNIDDPIVNFGDIAASVRNTEALRKKILDEFKLSGMALAEMDAVRGMDSGINGYSEVLKNVMLKKDGGFKAGSQVATREQFDMLIRHANRKILEAGERILSGDVSPSPVKTGRGAPCGYCEYFSVCQKPLRRENKFRNMSKISGKDMWEKLKNDDI
ncbi:MAG: PD-(D/E)XK nuclease family protein [Clostridiales bacterium]|jgi:ATP-dependent helicase/nuclease subunit B|nr:PD-(D/E)XK nuclease family protein [Clostridiales bacterium]